jgi:nucleoside-diphosphate-sugar epimerase
VKIIVTGSSGFIGQHLIRILEPDHLIVPLDRQTGWDLRQGLPRDILEDTDLVIHLAAKVSRVLGEDDLIQTATDNAVVTTLVANACGETNTRLIYASTSEIYGDGGGTEWQEDHFPIGDYFFPAAKLPHNLYGLSKRWGEEACKLYAPNGLTIMRFSMPYGPGLLAGRGRAAIINFLYDALWDRTINVHKQSERSWCWIGDTVQAVKILVDGGHTGAYNIGRDDNALPLRRVAEMACELVGADTSLIEMVDPPPNQTVVKRLSTKKMMDLGWTPKVDLLDGMSRTLEFVRTLPAPMRIAA